MSTQFASPNEYGPSISLEDAKKVTAAALSVARKNNWTMAVAIVDPGGYLVYYEKMDHTQLGGANISVEKARCAALFKRSTRIMQDMLDSGSAGLRMLALPGAVPVEGGIPLISEDKIVGAIGISGSSSANDGLCAQAGADALK
jgi:uncharacterized protein GlcG (DUF336 family)